MEIRTAFHLKNLNGRDSLGDVGIEGVKILMGLCILEKKCVRSWTGMNWLRTGSSGGNLGIR
jgi:hypothetical protein